MTAFFPAGLPQKPLAGSWTETKMPNIAAFRPEGGGPITRRRQSGAPYMASGSFNFTKSQQDQFWEWWENDLEDGALAFYWNHPTSNQQHKWKFDPDAGPPSFEQLAHHERNNEGMTRATFTLIRLA